MENYNDFYKHCFFFHRSELNLIRKFVVILGLQITSALALWLMARYILVMVYAALGGDVLPEQVRKLI